MMSGFVGCLLISIKKQSCGFFSWAMGLGHQSRLNLIPLVGNQTRSVTPPNLDTTKSLQAAGGNVHCLQFVCVRVCVCVCVCGVLDRVTESYWKASE